MRTNGVARINDVIEHRAGEKISAREMRLKSKDHTPVVTVCTNSILSDAQRYGRTTGRAVLLNVVIFGR